MGQARARKASEPHYGKIKSPNKMRGIIISAPVKVSEGKMIYEVDKFLFDRQDLRFSLFFWDRLSWPRLALQSFELVEPDIDYLQSAGILERPSFFSLGNQAQALVKGVVQALNDYEEKAPGMWTLGTGVNSITTDTQFFEPNAGTAIELKGCVPIPSKDVPINDILEFRHKRRDELILFRQYIDELANEINNGSDSADALIKAKANIYKSCEDLFRTTKEWQLPLNLSNFKAEFNFSFSNAIDKAGKAWGSLTAMGAPDAAVKAGSVVAALESQINITEGVKLRSFKKPMSPFKYAYSIERTFQL